MGVVRRLVRRRMEPRDAIERAWDLGLPPPAQASLQQFHDHVIDCYFFRRVEAPGMQQWTGLHHPFAREWSEALRAGMPSPPGGQPLRVRCSAGSS